MKNSMLRLSSDERSPEVHNEQRINAVYSEFDKYTSLFNILRGYEEFTLNAFGCIISSNLEAVNITGYEEWEVLGKSISMFYTPADQAAGKPEADLEKVKSEGKITLKGWRLKKRNVNFWAKIKLEYLNPVTSGNAAFRMVMQDATHKAMYRYRVKKIKSEYLNLFNNAYTGIFRFRFSNGHIMLMNDKAHEIVGLDKTKLLSFQELFCGPEEYARFLKELQMKENVLDFEFKANCCAQEQWLSLTCKYFYQEDFVEGIMMDVTEKKRQVLELERLNHELDQFIYHASHDMRSPLTTLLGLINLIQLEQPKETVLQYTRMIEERVLHLDRLLRDLVSITFNNNTGLAVEPFEVDHEVGAILKEFNVQYPAVRCTVTTHGTVKFYTDPVRVRVIIRNLVSNALKYHHPEAMDPMVEIDIRCDREKATLTFSDNGIGIETKYHSQVFEMFFRASTRHSGTGLGLFIVKGMVDKLNGKISLTSAKGEGTKIQLELPNHGPSSE